MDHVLTLVAARTHISLDRALITAVTEQAEGETPIILSDAEAVDIPCPALTTLAPILAEIGARPIDVFLTQSAGRRKQLLVADMDSTIVTGETLDELAAFAGKQTEIAAITARSMNGEIDFATALRERVGMLRGLALAALDQTWAGTRLTDGARELVGTMRAHGALAALVSGGFTVFTSRVAALCGFDVHRANVLHDDGRVLTGTVEEPILDRDAKLQTLQELAAQRGLPCDATLAIGDGANDLAMLGAAGFGIAFHAKPVVARAARHQIRHGNLRAALFAQGYPASAFVSH